VPISATLEINETVGRLLRAGEQVVPLGFGEAGLPVHPQLQSALRDGAHLAGYGPVAGTAALREAAAGYWDRRALPTDPDLVVAGPGSKPLLYGLLHAVGGDVALAKPSWVTYAAQARLLTRRAAVLATLPGQGGVPDPDLLRAKARAGEQAGRPLRCVVLTLPDNPTGTLAGYEAVQAVCQVARDHDLVVICDQIYRDLVHDPTCDFPDPAQLAPERTVVTTGLSKSLAVGGWRIGVARLPPGRLGEALRADLTALASEIWSSPAQPVQHAAAWAFTEPEVLRARVEVSRALHARIAGCVADLFTAAGATLTRPTAAFYLYPDLSGARSWLARRHSIRTGSELATALLRRHRVAVLPGVAFGDDDAALTLRVATSLLYGSNDEQRESALAEPQPQTLPWIDHQLGLVAEALAALVGPT
jgi:aspartate aminotransferase